ncbi:unnamed protein product [Phytophthora lilii]|uniref:Unnamed protein product n=1 Tax=Phytophthora lilii TaxID=2077276 RepID=A0A9W7D7W8_9STRA|nr:unnamed protein product [Phytophthora lilii]
MGWTFNNLGEGDCSGTPLALKLSAEFNEFNGVRPLTPSDLYSPRDNADLTHTAFGKAVEIPSEFVAPTTSARSKQKPTSSSTRIYRKRATGPTTSSSAKTHPASDLSTSTPRSTGCNNSKSPNRRTRKPHNKTERPKAEPVDFVYDINVRRKLREQLDAERRRLLQEATARETELRAENKWVFDKRDTSPPRRKQAWQPSPSPSKTVSTPSGSGSSSRASSRLRARASSAPSQRSASSSTSTCHKYSASVSSPRRPHVDAMEDVEASIREFERRLQTQRSLHVESSN